MRTSLLLLRLLTLLSLTLLIACQASVPPADFVWNNAAEPESLDPAIVTGVPEGRLLRCIFEGLTTQDPKTLEPRPGMASSWEISDDGRTYTFHLRAARWSNGDPVTSRDFVYSWERVLRAETAAEYAYQLWYIRGGRDYTEQALWRVDPDGSGARLLPAAWQPTASPCGPAEAAARACSPKGEVRRIEPGTVLHVLRDAASRPRAVTYSDPSGEDKRWFLVNAGGWVHEDDLVQDAGLLGIRAPDERTLIVELNNPTAYFLGLTSFHTLYPVHRATVETWGDQWIKPEHIVTNGPYRLASWRLNQWIEFEKNPLYWNADAVRIERARALPIDHATTGFNVYVTGQVDWVDSAAMPGNLMDLIVERDDFHAHTYLGTYFFRLNVGVPPLNDRRVRRALALAIDREAIVTYLLKAGQKPAMSFVPPGLPGYQTPADALLAMDVDEAQRLLAEAGFPGGRGFPTIEVLYNTSERHKDIAEVLQQQWKENLGIHVELVNQEWKVYINSVSKLDYQIARGGWIGDYVDPNTFLDMFVTDGGNNNTGWSHPDYDRLIAEAAAELDATRRMALFQQAEALLLDEVPIVPIYFYVSSNMVKPWVRGFYPNVLDLHPLQTLWIDEALRNRLLAQN